MPSKKTQIAFKTKLQKRSSEKSDKKSAPPEKVGLLKDTKYYPKSYRWRAADIEMIQQLVNRINEVSSRKLDTTKVLRGALLVASQTNTNKLLDAISKAERESIFKK